MKIKFGINDRKVINGATLYLRIFQISSLLPLFYIFLINVYPAVIMGQNLWSILFELGIVSIPRAEALLLSFLYKLMLNEVVIYFVLLVFAFVYGLILKKLLGGPEKRAILIRKILIILIFLDLVLRLLPFPFNYSFAWYFVVIGCLVRVASIIFLILDLKRQ
ncbi:MAG: hypothetical protein J6S31_07035 [Lachnospiraceae bacterium]|nr:hypothetical protein [Lachnospiraceae bacterium]